MSKYIYILILLIINSHAWNLRVINFSQDTWLVLQLVYLIAGIFFYGRMSDSRLSSKELKYWRLWVLGILLSMIPAYVNYGQSLSQSIIAYRQCALLIQIPALFKIAPSKEDIIKAIMIYFGIVWIIYFLQESNPFIVNVSDEQLDKILRYDESIMVAGWIFILIALFQYLSEIIDNFSIKNLSIIVLLYTFAFLEQNRSILFTITILVFFTIIKAKANKINSILVFILLLGTLVYYTADTWTMLFDETSKQIKSDDYNRNKAYLYFLFEACPNILCYILGNGFLSSHATSHMQDMMSQGVYNSDVGFIGYWNQFGILPIIVFIMLLVPAAIGRNNSHFIRCWAIQILICSLTISYWGSHNMLYMSLFYYLYHLDLEENAKTADETEYI